MARPKRSNGDDKLVDRDALIRLANSAAPASISDLDEEDFRMIARIPRKLADS